MTGAGEEDVLAREIRFRTTGVVDVATDRLTPVTLSPPHTTAEDVDYVDEAVVFRSEGWYEVLLEVEWDPAVRRGTRFCHTAVPGQQPLHSEAIDASVLADISGGRQLLRGNTLFGPERTARLALEVWHNAGEAVEIRQAGITVRELAVPWGVDRSTGDVTGDRHDFRTGTGVDDGRG